MSLRTAYSVTGRATALLVTGLVATLLGLTVLLPRIGGATPYTILTGSMRPGMPPGTVVVVRPKPLNEIRIGDVITYQIASGRPEVVTHRVRSIAYALDGSRTLITQGDANNGRDRLPVRGDQVRGVRWYSVPYVGRVSMAVSGNVRQLAVVLSVVALLAYAAVSFLREARDRRRGPRAHAPAASIDRDEVNA